MPLTAFVDKKVFERIEEINKENKSNKEILFPEHEFLAACLRMGLKIEDLKILSYIDVYKIFISFFNSDKEEENGTRIATQEDIQNLVAKM